MDRPPARHESPATTIMVMISSAALAVMVAGASACVDEPELTTLPDPDGGPTATSDGAPGNDDAAVIDDTVARAACAVSCPGAGGTCDGAVCVVTCPGATSCATGVTCPAGVACHVTCDGKESCKFVDCGTATICKVDCTGEQACESVRGDGTQSEIACTGKDACKSVTCGGETCAVQCASEGCKTGEVRCCARQCTVNGAPGRCAK